MKPSLGQVLLRVTPVLLLLPSGSQGKRVGRLDRSRAFFYPAFAAKPDSEVAKLGDGAITAQTYGRYLAARLGSSLLEDLAFDLALALECKARGLARSAPALARPLGAQRFRSSGRSAGDDVAGDVQRKFVNEALRGQRIDALVRADRDVAARTLRAAFEQRYGEGGVRVRVRHILVSLAATKRRLGSAKTPDEVLTAARARAASLRARLRKGEAFQQVLRATDDRMARRMLRSPRQAAKAGFLVGYNYVRYGQRFADAVRGLAVGEVSAPVRTSHGFHLIEVTEREVTKFDDVAEGLQVELRRRQTSPSEVAALRRKLLRKYGFALTK